MIFAFCVVQPSLHLMALVPNGWKDLPINHHSVDKQDQANVDLENKKIDEPRSLERSNLDNGKLTCYVAETMQA